MNPVRLQVVIPFHQPISADAEAIEHAIATCYEPVLTAIERARGVKLAIHFTGHLLDYLSRRREDFLLRVKQLARAERVEILGGLFYGAFPALLPELDVRGQLQMTSEYWESSVGRSPQGFWLPELAWSAELPRMFAETGLEFGFVSSSQVDVEHNRAFGLSIIERGGARLGAFIINDALSRALPSSPVDEWIDAAIDQAAPSGGQVLSVFIRAEALGLEPGSHPWCHSQGWLGRWLEAIAGGRAEMKTVLPSASFATERPACHVRLVHRCADGAEAMGRNGEAMDWPDFVMQFSEVDGLHRRMLRASDKLREAIATMEDEGLEDAWSSDLATAQRLIFSAQAPDPYWRGRVQGFGDPRVRDAAMNRLAQAEATLDNLVQGEEEWISAEEEDRDGDLVDEVFVSTPHVTAWLVPAEGGRVRAFDDRSRGRNVLDVVSRRDEPFFAAMREAPLREDATEVQVPRRPGEPVPRLTAELPTQVDRHERRGIGELVFDAGTSAEELFSGSARELLGGRGRWQQVSSGIDEAGDLTYRLTTRLDAQLDGTSPRQLQLERTVHVPIDRAEVRIDYKASVGGKTGVLLASEIPLRLGTGVVSLAVDGKDADAAARAHHDVTQVRVSGEDGSVVELDFSPAIDVWTDVVRAAVRDVDGYRSLDQGLVIMPVLRVDGAAEGSVTLRVVPVEADAEPEGEEGDESEEGAGEEEA